jgi:hypothetical protein
MEGGLVSLNSFIVLDQEISTNGTGYPKPAIWIILKELFH